MIRTAAIMLPETHQIFQGYDHSRAYNRFTDAARENLELFDVDQNEIVEGFLTVQGVFLTREEAFNYAKKHLQLKHPYANQKVGELQSYMVSRYA